MAGVGPANLIGAYFLRHLPWLLLAVTGHVLAGTDGPVHAHDAESRWALELGVAVITEKGMDDLYRRSGTFAKGDAGGQIWLTTLYYTLGTHRWTLGGRSFHPRSELHLTLGLVDENARSPFLDYNAALALRWTDFPWNHRVATTFATGIGFSYSERVFAMDIQRHPNSHRSRLKFDWPLQVTLAHPRHPRHQLVLFNQHQSGGYIFDRGGVNSHGIGYRYVLLR